MIYRGSWLTCRVAYSTFLKRKGGLFKKAHELSVLCSVDVAVFIFGSNKKLYEYSSTDMREMITRYTYVSRRRKSTSRSLEANPRAARRPERAQGPL